MKEKEKGKKETTLLTHFKNCMPAFEHFSSAPSGNLNGSFDIECVSAEFVRPLNGLRPNTSS